MRLRKMLHSKSRPAKDVFFVSTAHGEQFRVVGRGAKQPEVGDVFQCVPARFRKNTLGRRTFKVLDIQTVGDVPIYFLEYVAQKVNR